MKYYKLIGDNPLKRDNWECKCDECNEIYKENELIVVDYFGLICPSCMKTKQCDDLETIIKKVLLRAKINPNDRH